MTASDPQANSRHRVRVGPVPIETELIDQLRGIAARHGRTLNGEFRYAIRVYVQSVQRRETASTPPNGN